MYFKQLTNKKNNKSVIALVANWDSNVGYAWRLIESFWIKISEEFNKTNGTIICYPTISILPDKIMECPAEKIVFNFVKKDIISILLQCSFIRKHQIKYLYLTDMRPTSIVYLFYRIAGVKTIVIHEHSPGVRLVSKGIKFVIKKTIARIPFINADACFGATEYVKQRLINVNCIPINKCFAIDNGILTKPEISAVIDVRTKYSLPCDSFVLVTTSRANKYKGIEFALNVVAKCYQDAPNINLYYLFIGDGPHLQVFKDLALNLGLQDKVVFTGKVDNVGELIATANCAIHPSFGEVGYSLSILEYMLAGLPVLVSDNPSVCEATQNEKTGLIYEEHNIDDAVNKLLRLYNSPSLIQTMSRLAKQTVISKYKLEYTHEKLITQLNRFFK